MNERIERYLQAGTRDNTRRSYQAAVEHFEVSWGGFLPATADSIARYLVDHAEQHSINTLKQRLAALAQWHISQGFPDPTKAPLVKQLLKGIRATHPAQPKQAAPLLVGQLEQVVAALEACAWRGAELHDQAMVLRARRDIALLLIGFWRGFRGDELARLEVQHIRAVAGTGMTLYLPHSKGDRLNQGVSYRAPALKRLCPVQAYGNWITAAGIAYGPVFRRIDRWGNLGAQGLHPNSLIPLLRGVLERGGLPAALYSSHSLRRGFATWANANGWDIKALMTYVGWKDMKSALRYIDPEMPFANLALAPG